MNIAAITGPITKPLKPNIAIRYRLVTRTITVWLGDRLYRSYVYVIDEPKLVTPGGKLSDWEKSNIELFQIASASVAYITTEQVASIRFGERAWRRRHTRSATRSA